jgi:hypothetical protein
LIPACPQAARRQGPSADPQRRFAKREGYDGCRLPVMLAAEICPNKEI